MAGEQTVTIAQTTTTTVKVVVNAIGSSGSHVPLVIDTTTTRLDGRSEVPTVYYPTGSTGIAEIRFSVTSSSLTEFTILICKVNGTADSVAFSEYAIPIKVLASETATQDSIAPNVWGEQESGYTIPIYAGSFGARLADAFDPATDTVTTDAASRTASQADVSALATAASIAALNDLSSTDVTNAVWDASVSSHNLAGSFGRAFRQVKEGLVSIDGQVNDLSATASSFITNLTAAVDDYYNGQTLHFISGSLAGQSQVIRDYNGTTKTITLDSALTSAPANADEFIVLSTHVHAISEITDSIWNAASSSYTTAGTFGYYLDARVSVSGGSGASAADIWGALLVDYATPGSFGARFQEADRYTNTSANIRYINQGDSYDGEANPVLSWSVTKDYTSYSLTLEITHRVTGQVLLSKAIAATDSTTIEASLSSTDTAFADLTTAADFGAHRYLIKATLGSSVDSAVIGAVVITET